MIANEQEIAASLFTADLHAHPTTVLLTGVTFPHHINDVRVAATFARFLWAIPCAFQKTILAVGDSVQS